MDLLVRGSLGVMVTVGDSFVVADSFRREKKFEGESKPTMK